MLFPNRNFLLGVQWLEILQSAQEVVMMIFWIGLFFSVYEGGLCETLNLSKLFCFVFFAFSRVWFYGLTLQTAASNFVSHSRDQTERCLLSITRATTEPSSVPNKHIHDVRESSAGQVSRVMAYRNRDEDLRNQKYYLKDLCVNSG